MKILFLNYEYPPLGGGAGQAAANILKEYAKLPGLEVNYVTSSTDSAYHLEQIGDNIRVHQLPIGKNPANLTYQSQWDILRYAWAAYRFSCRLLRRNRYDLTHAFFGVPCGFIALLLKRRYGLPYIVSLRGSDVPGYSARFSLSYIFLKPLIVSVWKHAHRVVANSQVLRALALQSNPRQPIEIIYNGVNTEKFSPALERNGQTQFNILCASRLSRRKGFRYAVEAFHLLASRYPHLHLTIAGGEGDAEGELKAQVEALGLKDRVTFTGYVSHDQFPAYYQAADVFVFPSQNEGMSNNMLEAMASGLPIIMTPTGGAEELIREGKNGFIVRMKDANDIAAKLTLLIEDRVLARRMGRASRTTAERMSWNKVSQAYQAVYQKIQSDSKDKI